MSALAPVTLWTTQQHENVIRMPEFLGYRME
jgi:hypothetical protein